MPPVGSFRTGKGARAQVEAVNLNKTDWDVDYKGDKLSSVNFECLGFDQSLVGIIGADWSVKGNWDFAQGQYVDPAGLYPRPDLGTTKLFTSVADVVYWYFPQSTVISGKNSANVKDLVKFEASCCSNGTFTAPLG